jgi:hypothetical protein
MSYESGATTERRSRKKIVLTAAALLLLTAGCTRNAPGGDPAEASPQPGIPVTASPGTALPVPETNGTITSPPSCELANGVRQATLRFKDYVALSAMYGTEVRMGDHDTGGECFERFVIELKRDGRLSSQDRGPGVHANYVKAPIKEDPSDNTIKVAGNAFLQVTMGSWMYGPQGASGPRRVSGSTYGVERAKEAVLTSNFESMTTWTIGLDKERDFTLSETAGSAECPDRCVVIDIEDN